MRTTLSLVDLYFFSTHPSSRVVLLLRFSGLAIGSSKFACTAQAPLELSTRLILMWAPNTFDICWTCVWGQSRIHYKLGGCLPGCRGDFEILLGERDMVSISGSPHGNDSNFSLPAHNACDAAWVGASFHVASNVPLTWEVSKVKFGQERNVVDSQLWVVILCWDVSGNQFGIAGIWYAGTWCSSLLSGDPCHPQTSVVFARTQEADSPRWTGQTRYVPKGSIGRVFQKCGDSVSSRGFAATVAVTTG